MKAEKKTFLSAGDMALCALFAALIATGAFLKIPIPYVPLTLQFLFTNLAGILLGGRRGAIAVLIYIIVGLAGIPVFTQGGGPAYILQPTFGYLLGFLPGAYFAGRISEMGAGGFWSFLLAGFVNFVFVYLLGASYLYMVTNFYLQVPLSLKKTLIIGVLTSAPGDILTVFACAFLSLRLRPILNRGAARA